MADGLGWFPFFPSNFMMATASFTNKERGMYISLLCYQWDHGGLPNDHSRLAAMLGCSEEDFAAAWALLSVKFFVGSDGRLRNPVLKKIHGEQTRRYRNRVRRARQGGVARAKRISASSKAQAGQSPAIKIKTLNIRETPLPPNLNVKSWDEYTAYRKRRRIKKYAPESAVKQTAWLAEHSMADQQAIVDRSIRNSWTGLFELDGGPSGKGTDASRIAKATGDVEV